MSMDLSTAKSHQKGCPNPAVGTSQIRFGIVRGGYNTNTIFHAPGRKKHTRCCFPDKALSDVLHPCDLILSKTIRLASPIFLEQEICHGKIQKCNASRIKHRDVGIAFTTRSLSKNEITKLSTDLNRQRNSGASAKRDQGRVNLNRTDEAKARRCLFLVGCVRGYEVDVIVNHLVGFLKSFRLV